MRIAQRIERHQLRPGCFQRVEIIRVIKAEGAVARDADAHLVATGQRADLGLVRNAQRFFLRQREQPVQIDLLRDRVADLLDLCGSDMGLIAGHQAEMPFDDAEPLVVMDRADYRHVGVMLDDRAQLGFVPRSAEVVEDHPGNVDVAVECLIAEDQRRDAARHAARIDHQKHRQVEQLRQGGVAVAAVQREAVVQSLVALDQIHFRTVPREGGKDVVALHQVQVQIAASAPGSLAEPHRIDVIGAFLEWLDCMPAFAQRGAQAYADHRFSG